MWGPPAILQRDGAGKRPRFLQDSHFGGLCAEHCPGVARGEQSAVHRGPGPPAGAHGRHTPQPSVLAAVQRCRLLLRLPLHRHRQRRHWPEAPPGRAVSGAALPEPLQRDGGPGLCAGSPRGELSVVFGLAEFGLRTWRDPVLCRWGSGLLLRLELPPAPRPRLDRCLQPPDDEQRGCKHLLRRHSGGMPVGCSSDLSATGWPCDGWSANCNWYQHRWRCHLLHNGRPSAAVHRHKGELCGRRPVPQPIDQDRRHGGGRDPGRGLPPPLDRQPGGISGN